MEEAQLPNVLSPGLRKRAGIITDVQMEKGEASMEYLSKERGSLTSLQPRI